jgi:hypothetical protein
VDGRRAAHGIFSLESFLFRFRPLRSLDVPLHGGALEFAGLPSEVSSGVMHAASMCIVDHAESEDTEEQNPGNAAKLLHRLRTSVHDVPSLQCQTLAFARSSHATYCFVPPCPMQPCCCPQYSPPARTLRNKIHPSTYFMLRRPRDRS